MHKVRGSVEACESRRGTPRGTRATRRPAHGRGLVARLARGRLRTVAGACALAVALVASQLLGTFGAWASEVELTPVDNFTIGVMSDPHYFPAEFQGTRAQAYQNQISGDPRLMGENEALTTAAVDQMLADADSGAHPLPKVLLVTGDLSSEGEKASQGGDAEKPDTGDQGGDQKPGTGDLKPGTDQKPGGDQGNGQGGQGGQTGNGTGTGNGGQNGSANGGQTGSGTGNGNTTGNGGATGNGNATGNGGQTGTGNGAVTDIGSPDQNPGDHAAKPSDQAPEQEPLAQTSDPTTATYVAVGVVGLVVLLAAVLYVLRTRARRR